MRKAGGGALLFIFILVLVDSIGFGIILPVLPRLIMQLAGVTVDQAAAYGGWLAFVYALLQFFCAPVLGVGYVLQNDFAQLADKFILGIWPFYVLTVAAVFVLRRRRPDLPRPYRAWGYPVTPLVFLSVTAFMMYYLVTQRPVQSLIGVLIMASGLAVYYLSRPRIAPGLATPT